MKTFIFRCPVTIGLLLFSGIIGRVNAQNIQIIDPPSPGEENFIQHSVAFFETGKYVVAGTYVHPFTQESDILVSMVDNSGGILWSRFVDYGVDEFVGAVIVDQAQRIVLTGYMGTNNSSFPPKNLIIVQLDPLGNLIDDLMIADPGGYSLYGFDIEWTASGDYIIAGTGVHAPSISSDKFAFVMHVRSDLSARFIFWGLRYETTVGNPFPTKYYDSFNDILPINGRGEFLLTGSGATPSGEQMITNDLIDITGTSLWPGQNPIGHHHEGASIYNNFGVKALYDGALFYVLYYGVENIPSILILDGSTGNFVDAVNIHNHAYPTTNEVNVLLNGMKWVGNDIVFSGYYIDFQAPYTGWPLLINWDGSGTSDWTKYQVPFDGNALKNTNLDFMVRPINYSNSTFPHMINQIYYQPKSLIISEGPVFAAPHQTGVSFDLAFVNTLDCSVITSGFDQTPSLTAYQFDSNLYTFAPIGPGALISNANPSSFILCGPQPAPKSSMGKRSLKNTSTITIYPNPASDYLSIIGLPKIEGATISIYDITGREVFVRKLNDGEERLFISELQSGIYIIRINSGETIVYQTKIVKE